MLDGALSLFRLLWWAYVVLPIRPGVMPGPQRAAWRLGFSCAAFLSLWRDRGLQPSLFGVPPCSEVQAPSLGPSSSPKNGVSISTWQCLSFAGGARPSNLPLLVSLGREPAQRHFRACAPPSTRPGLKPGAVGLGQCGIGRSLAVILMDNHIEVVKSYQLPDQELKTNRSA